MLGKRILIVDDEPSVREVVGAYLGRQGFTVFLAVDGRQALELALTKEPDLVVLDLMLPDLAGEEVCREIRRRSDVPIIMLTAKSSERDRVEGLDIGADDYVTKPFSPRELVARIHAILRRGAPGAPLVRTLRFDGGRLEIDTVRREVRIGGHEVELSPSEYLLLTSLARFPGRVYSRSELIGLVRGDDSATVERTIDAHIKNLRKKIEPDPAEPRCIKTVHGIGYRMDVARSS